MEAERRQSAKMHLVLDLVEKCHRRLWRAHAVHRTSHYQGFDRGEQHGEDK